MPTYYIIIYLILLYDYKSTLNINKVYNRIYSVR